MQSYDRQTSTATIGPRMRRIQAYPRTITTVSISGGAAWSIFFSKAAQVNNGLRRDLEKSKKKCLWQAPVVVSFFQASVRAKLYCAWEGNWHFCERGVDIVHVEFKRDQSQKGRAGEEGDVCEEREPAFD